MVEESFRYRLGIEPTNRWVSASQLRSAPPLGHLFAYLLASNFIVPMQVPTALRADA